MQKILILEDDQHLSRTLVDSLESPRTMVTATGTLDDFYEQAEKELVDLCLMDRMIGGEDSADSLGYIREILPQARMLFLSKKTAIKEKVTGLEAGADDYLAKPFSLAELKLRVQSLLSLQRAPASPTFQLGSVDFSPQAGVIKTPEGKILLRPRESEILSCLCRSLGSVVSKRAIHQQLWPESYEPNPNTIDVYIRRLRQKLGKYHSILKTRRGFGYLAVAYERE